MLQGVVSKAWFRRQPRSGQKNLHGNVCAHQQQLCQKAWNWEEASPHYPRRDAGRALLETSTELLGADQMVTAVKHRFSKTTWPHTVVGAVAGEWTDVCGFVKQPNSCDKWKVRLHGAFTIPRETLASVQEIKVATSKCGCTCTLLATSKLALLEEITSNGSFSKKGPVHTRQTKRKAGTMMKATAHFHPCHPCEDLCLHKQPV